MCEDRGPLILLKFTLYEKSKLGYFVYNVYYFSLPGKSFVFCQL